MRILIFSIALFSILGFSNSCLFAQYNKSKSVGKETKESNNTNDDEEPFKKGFDKKKIIFGGGLGLRFGNVTNINVNPILGYRFAKKFGAGISASYNYYSETGVDVNTLLNYKFSAQTIGGGIWAKAFLFENIFKSSQFISNIFLIGSYEENRIKYTETIPNSTLDLTSKWYPSLLAGIGLRQRISNYASLNILLMHDWLQQSPVYIKQPLIFTVGTSFGL
ncbi:MAG: hypothetical protein RJA07_1028 [Bacteroidota bacterium]|jgi:hypothetical protein